MYTPRFELKSFEGRPPEEKVGILHMLLEALIAANLLHLRHNATLPLYAAGIRYEEEVLGQDNWQDIPRTIELGYGDCEDLASWRIAELRFVGEWALPHVKHATRGDLTIYHIQVRRGNGSIEDPSRKLGMKGMVAA